MNARKTSNNTNTNNDAQGGNVVKGDNGAASVAPEGTEEAQANGEAQDQGEKVEAPEEEEEEVLDLTKLTGVEDTNETAFSAFLGNTRKADEPRTAKQTLLDSIDRQMKDSRTRDYTGPTWWVDHNGQTALHMKLNNHKLVLPNGRQTMIIQTAQFQPVLQALRDMVVKGDFDDQIDIQQHKMDVKRSKAARTRASK